MFSWITKLESSTNSAKEILGLFEEMLDDGRHAFDLAANSLVGGTDPDTIKEDLWSTDKRINQTERKIRRRLLTHSSTYGRGAFATDLVLMSLVKDAERIGDYAKNIFDLAALGATLSPESHEDLTAKKDQVSQMLVRAKNIYASENEDQAREFIAEADAFCLHCDKQIDLMLKSEDGKSTAAALAYRFFKRVVSHSLNIITSLVVPLDKLDYYDEDPETRG